MKTIISMLLATTASVAWAASAQDDAAKTWTVVTTDAAYVFTADDIAALKAEAWRVTLQSGSTLGATVGFGEQTSAQKSHFIIASGTHAMTWLDGNEAQGTEVASMDFDTTGTADDPSILVRDGATLNLTTKDMTGWEGSAQAKAGNVIRVNGGGTLNLLPFGTTTHFYQGRYWLDPGATLSAAEYAEGKFRLNGGAVEGFEQLYVPDTTAAAPAATIAASHDLRVSDSETAGVGVYVGTNGALVIDAELTSDADVPLTKRGEGTLTLGGALTNFTGTLTAQAGTLEIARPELGGTIAVAKGAVLSLAFDGEPQRGDVVMRAGAAVIEDNAPVLINGRLYAVVEKTSNAVAVSEVVAEVGGRLYASLDEAVAAAGQGGVMKLYKPVEEVRAELAAKAITLEDIPGETNRYRVALLMAAGPALVMTEIMPKPTDASSTGSLCGMDPNGLESGWVEVVNTSNAWVDLKDYKFIRVNRGKANSKGDYGNFPSRLIAPHARFVFWTSERYANSADMSVSAYVTPVESEKPAVFGDMVVWPDKVNPKKSAFVRLYYAPDGVETSIIDTVVIPTDLPEGMSILVEPVQDGAATVRYVCPAPTRGEPNPAVTGLEKLGPNIGPLYEIADGKKHASANEFGSIPPAKVGEDYAIAFALNPTMHPTAAQTKKGLFRAEDAIANVTLVYRTKLAATTQTTNVDLTARTWDAKDQGYTYNAVIPHTAFDGIGPGQLVQWKFVIADACGNTWTSPSFHNKDDGYEWYGTITEPDATQTSVLPTWHMFVEGESLTQMDVDADEQTLPYKARAAIYDGSTSNYYDYVRIDLRGNTSGAFAKKSHGFRFAKAHPLTMRDIVTGEDIEEIRKTSLIAEGRDPSLMRQMMAFWLFRKMGNHVPFDFPTRCNLNGEFYQLAFNSERFTDELIEDVYKLDKFGYSYKNASSLKVGDPLYAGGIEKKTPDDGNEGDLAFLYQCLRDPLIALGVENVQGTTTAAKSMTTTDPTGLDNAALTKFVVEKYDLAAWINYLASARITQETDDVWSNLSLYCDDPAMKEGVRGTGTWMPLGYDFNLSFGQWYWTDTGKPAARLMMADEDCYKSHPFYGGLRVRCWNTTSYTTAVEFGNNGMEAVWQNSKFRRLYLRRLRTLMDEQLKAPGTPETEVPFMVEMRRLAELMRTDAATDRAKYPRDSEAYDIDVWPGETWPATVDAAIQDIWDNYVVPRQRHFYVTHSVTNTSSSWKIGYGSRLNAGIPEAQSPIVSLREKITAAYDATIGAVVIRNANAETIDVSGWRLSGPVEMTIPAGTVLDRFDGATTGEVYVTANRRTTVAALAVTDQVVVGNGKAGTAAIRLLAADGTEVFAEEIGVAPGEEVAMQAKTEAEAQQEIAKYVVALTPEDTAAGMTTDMVKMVAVPVKDAQGAVVGYKAQVAVNPDVVPVPAVGGAPASAVEPIVVTPTEEGASVSVGIVNAVRGLWYGYEVSATLGGTFANDVPSFKRAEGAEIAVTGTPQPGASAFFRVKVLAAQPQE